MGRALVQDILRNAKIAAMLLYGVGVLNNRPAVRYNSPLDKLLGGPGKWHTSQKAKLIVARTFSGYRIRGMAISKDDTFSHDDCVCLVQCAHPPNWAEIDAFRTVRGWWQWLCRTNTRLALEVDLLSNLLLAAEALFGRKLQLS